MMISFIIPVKDEEENVIPLFKEIEEVMGTMNQQYEVIFVDDGSKDNTVKNLREMFIQGNKTIKIIQLRKNYKKSAAMSVGFDLAQGEIIITLDGDGQDNPYEIPKMLEALTEDVDVVCAWRKKRKDAFFIKTLPSRIYNLMNKWINGIKIHDNDCNFRIYRKEAIDNLVLLEGDHRFVPVILKQRGFELTEIKVEHRRRKTGKSKYGSRRLFEGFTDLINFKLLNSFGQRPLRAFFSLGILSILTSLGTGIHLLIRKFVYKEGIGTRPLLTLTVLLAIAGFQFVLTGMLGELVVRHRISKSDLYSIKNIYTAETEKNEREKQEGEKKK